VCKFFNRVLDRTLCAWFYLLEHVVGASNVYLLCYRRESLLQPPARMPACRPRVRHDPSLTGVASPSSSSSEPLLDVASPTAPCVAAQRSPRSPSTADGVGSCGVQAANSCPSAASDDDSGCALEEYAWVPPGLSALQV